MARPAAGLPTARLNQHAVKLLAQDDAIPLSREGVRQAVLDQDRHRHAVLGARRACGPSSCSSSPLASRARRASRCTTTWASRPRPRGIWRTAYASRGRKRAARTRRKAGGDGRGVLRRAGEEQAFGPETARGTVRWARRPSPACWIAPRTSSEHAAEEERQLGLSQECSSGLSDWTDFVALWAATSAIVMLLGIVSWWRGLSDEGTELRDWRFLLKSSAIGLGISVGGGLLLAVVYVALRAFGTFV